MPEASLRWRTGKQRWASASVEHNTDRQKPRDDLSVRLLEASACATTTELLRFAATRIGDKEGPVVREQLVLQLLLGRLVDELLVVRDDALRDRLTDGVDLAGVTTAANAQADVNVGEALRAQDEQRLEHLHAQTLGLEQVKRRTVELHQPLTVSGNVRDRDRSLLPAETLHGVLHSGPTHDERVECDLRPVRFPRLTMLVCARGSVVVLSRAGAIGLVFPVENGSTDFGVVDGQSESTTTSSVSQVHKTSPGKVL